MASSHLAAGPGEGTGPERSPWGWAGRRIAPLITALGLSPRTVTLETVGRQSGRRRRVSVTVTTLDGRDYIVALYGESSAWVANVRASGGRAAIVSGGKRDVSLTEVPSSQRPTILHSWVTRRAFTHSPSSSAEVFFGFDHVPTIEELGSVADRFPVFEVVPLDADEH